VAAKAAGAAKDKWLCKTFAVASHYFLETPSALYSGRSTVIVYFTVKVFHRRWWDEDKLWWLYRRVRIGDVNAILLVKTAIWGCWALHICLKYWRWSVHFSCKFITG
jgi:hypothetical protein